MRGVPLALAGDIVNLLQREIGQVISDSLKVTQLFLRNVLVNVLLRFVWVCCEDIRTVSYLQRWVAEIADKPELGLQAKPAPECWARRAGQWRLRGALPMADCLALA